MRYPIDFKDDFANNLQFWIEKYIYSKITSLTNHRVNNRAVIESALKKLALGCENINELKDLCKNVRNAGLLGVQTYSRPLFSLYEFLCDKGLASLKECDEETLREFLAIYTSALSDASKKNFRIAIINFFSFIDRQNENEDGSAYLFRIALKGWGGLRGKSGEKLPAYMNENEIMQFLEAIESYPFKHQNLGARNRLLLKIIIFTGIRVSEACSLRLNDIAKDGELFALKIRGKGNKQRMVMLKCEKIQRDLEEWQKARAAILAATNNPQNLLFLNHKSKPLTQAYISRIVEQILISCGIRKEKNGAHMLRHSFATLLYQKSQDLVLLQEALGHADLNTSRIYTHFDKERLKKATEIF